MNEQMCVIGIDISKTSLDVAVLPQQEQWSVNNDDNGINQLLSKAKQLPPHLIVMEATASLHLAVAGALGAAGLPVAVLNPQQVHDFAKSTGKTGDVT